MTSGAAEGEEAAAELARASDLLRGASSVVVLTGAGISAESGVPTFRGEGGMWREHRPEELATPGAFRRDPELVWAWYRWRRERVGVAAPNPGHRALARLQLGRPDVTLVTQNVDALHEEALREEALRSGVGEPREALEPLHLHGSIFRTRCTGCGERSADPAPVDGVDAGPLPSCPGCGGLLRPDVVWFGEGIPSGVLDRSFEAARGSDVALVVGTSALVQPAASLPLATLDAGGGLVEVNPDPTPLSARATVRLAAPAGSVLPVLVDEVLGGGG